MSTSVALSALLLLSLSFQGYGFQLLDRGNVQVATIPNVAPSFVPRVQHSLPLSATTNIEENTQSGKVREMASFLALKLLEKAVTEVAKDENESKMTEEDILNLASAVQSISEPTAEVSAPAEEDSEPVVPAAAEEKVEPPPVTAVEEMTEPEPLTGISLQQDEQESPETRAKTELLHRSLLEARIQNDAKTTTQAVTALEEPKKEEAPQVVPKIETVVPAVADEPPVPSPSDTYINSPRFPDVISKEFGKPLEVAESSIPALRPESFPKASSTLEFEPTSTDTLESSIEPAVPPASAPKGESLALRSTSPSMAFVEGSDGTDTNPKDPLAAKYAAMSLEDRAFAILDDLGIASTIEIRTVTPQVDSTPAPSTNDPTSAATTTESTLSEDAKTTMDEPTTNTALDSESKSIKESTSLPEETSPDVVARPTPASIIQMIPVAAIQTLLRRFWDWLRRLWKQVRKSPNASQPLAPAKESQLQSKYAAIDNVEERAYTILKDLGMI